MSRKVRCLYCGALYNPDELDHEPVVDYDVQVDAPVECVIVPLESLPQQRLRGSDY